MRLDMLHGGTAMLADVAQHTLINSRYQLRHTIGTGGMGIVYEAFDLLYQREVALKRLIVDPIYLEHASMATSSNILLSLAREFQTLASIRHPNIIAVIDYGFDETKNPYLVMELLKHSEPITDFAKAASFEKKANLLISVLQALSYLHRRTVIHRDLKPDNILVAEGVPRLLDFGLSVKRGQETETEGTLAYMAPEIFRGSFADVASDLYAFGVIAYEVFTGNVPHYAADIQVMIQNIMRKEADLTPLPKAVRPIIGALLSKSANSRPKSADEVMRLFGDVLKSPIIETSLVRESFLQASSFVGRATEMHILSERLDQASKGNGLGYLIGGESGVGKSRLVDEISTRALVTGFRVFRGQGIAEGGQHYQLWRGIIRHSLLTTEISDLEAGILKILVPEIEKLVGRSIPDVADVGEEIRQSRLQQTIVDLLLRQSVPMLIILEDLQWAVESLEPLKLLLNRIKDRPLMVIGTYRNDESPGLPAEIGDVSVLVLDRLDQDAVATLCQSMLGARDVSNRIVGRLYQETEGNVFFLVEVVRALAEETGALNEVAQMTLPRRIFAGGIEQVVKRRLEKVSESDQWLLKLTAIVGRQIDLRVLEQFVDDSLLNEWLQVCDDAAILEMRDEQWRFSHDKIREAILAPLVKAEKTKLYQQVAEALEAVYTDEKAYHTQLFYLWFHTGNVTKSIDYSEKAIQQQFSVSNGHRALEIVEETLEQLGQYMSPHIRLRFEQLLAEAHYRLSNYEEALALLSSLHPRLHAEGLHESEADCLHTIGHIYSQQGKYEECLIYANLADEIGRELGNERLIAQVYLTLGIAHAFHENLDKAEELTLAAEEIFLKLNMPERVAKVLNNLGIIHLIKGHADLAIDCFLRGCNISREIGDRRNVFNTTANLGVLYIATGKLEQARELMYQAHEMALSLERGAEVMTLLNLGSVHLELAEYETARPYLMQALTLAREMQMYQTVADVLEALAALETVFGHHETALKYAQEGYEISCSYNMQRAQVLMLHRLATIYRDQERFDEAQVALEKSLEVSDAAGIHLDRFSLYVLFGSLFEIQDQMNTALKWYWQANDTIDHTSSVSSNVIVQAHISYVLLRKETDIEQAMRLLLAVREDAQQIVKPVDQLVLILSLLALLVANTGLPRQAPSLLALIRQHPALDMSLRLTRLAYLEKIIAVSDQDSVFDGSLREGIELLYAALDGCRSLKAP